MTLRSLSIAVLTGLALLAETAAAARPAEDQKLVERGKYLVRVSGCNDCHTHGYMQSDGNIPTERWLTGSAVGFQGPWGTSYPSNLRLTMQGMSEAQWRARAHQPMRPPMPWFNLKSMTDRDLVAIYRFVRSLGPAGEPTPAAAAPGVAVTTPYFEFVPKNLPAPAKHAER